MSSIKYIKASPNEELLVMMAANKEKRKQRLLQVRQQDKITSLKLCQKVKETKDSKMKETIMQQKDEIIKQRKADEMQLMKEFERRLQLVGGAHDLQGKENLGVKKHLSVLAQLNMSKRYQNAIKQVQEHQHQKASLLEEEKQLRKRVQSMEKGRSQEVLSKPRPCDPIANLKPVKYVAGSLLSKQGMDTFSSTRYHLGTTYLHPEFLVEKVRDKEQIDAKEAASEENERLRLSKEKHEREMNERREKAELRHRYAQKEVLLNQKKDVLLEELEKLNFEDRNRRRQLVADIPKKIFQPPYQREKDEKSKQYEIEQAFERLYDVKCDDPMEMYYQTDKDLPQADAYHKEATDQLEKDKGRSTIDQCMVQLPRNEDRETPPEPLSEDLSRSPIEHDKDSDQCKADAHPQTKLEQLRRRIKSQKDKQMLSTCEAGFSDLDSASVKLRHGTPVDGLQPMNIESACDSHSIKSSDPQKNKLNDQPSLSRSLQGDKGRSENPLTKQNIAFNERLLEHQKRVMELQKRHLHNKKINQQLVDAANQQEVHIYVPQSFSMVSPSTGAASDISKSDTKLAKVPHSKPRQQGLFVSSNDELNLSLQESDGDVSLSISVIPSQHDDHKDFNENHNKQATTIDEPTLESNIEIVTGKSDKIPSDSTTQPNVVENKTVEATQTMDVDEQEVATQTSFTYDVSTTSINADDSSGCLEVGSKRFPLCDKLEVTANKKGDLRRKYPNIFDDTQSKETSSILDRMFSVDQNQPYANESHTPSSVKTQEKQMFELPSKSPSPSNNLTTRSEDETTNLQRDRSTSSMKSLELDDSQNGRPALYESEDFDLIDVTALDVNIRNQELVSEFLKFAAARQLSDASQQQANNDTTNDFFYQAEDDENMTLLISNAGESFARVLNEEPSLKSMKFDDKQTKPLPTVDSILQELQILQGKIVSEKQDNQRDTVVSAEADNYLSISGSSPLASFSTIAISTISVASTSSTICSRDNVPVLTSHGHRTFHSENIPLTKGSSVSMRPVRVSEHPHVSPIKEIEEVTSKSKQSSVGSLQEQYLPDFPSFHAQMESYGYSEDGLSLVRGSSTHSTKANGDELFLPLHMHQQKANNHHVQPSFKSSLNSTLFGSHRDTRRDEHFHLLEDDASAEEGRSKSIPKADLEDLVQGDLTALSVSLASSSATASIFANTMLTSSIISTPSTPSYPLLNTSNVFQKLQEISSNTPTTTWKEDNLMDRTGSVSLDQNNANSLRFLPEPFGSSSSGTVSSSRSASEKYQALLERVKQLPLVHAQEQRLLLESYQKLTERALSRNEEFAEHSLHTFVDLYQTNEGVECETVSHNGTNIHQPIKENQIYSNVVPGENNIDFQIDSLQLIERFDVQEEPPHMFQECHGGDEGDTGKCEFVALVSSNDSVHDLDDDDVEVSRPSPIVFSSHAQHTPRERYGDMQWMKQIDDGLQQPVGSIRGSSISDAQHVVKDKFVMSYFHDTSPDLTSFPKQSESVSDLNSMLSLTQESFLPLPGSMRWNPKRSDITNESNVATNVKEDSVVIIGRQGNVGFSETFNQTTECNSAFTQIRSPHINDASKTTHSAQELSHQMNNQYAGMSSDRTMTELMNLSLSSDAGSHSSFVEKRTMDLISQLISSKSIYSDTESSELFTVGRLELRDARGSKQSDDDIHARLADLKTNSSTMLAKESNSSVRTDLSMLSDLNLSELSESCVNWSTLVPISKSMASSRSCNIGSSANKDGVSTSAISTQSGMSEKKQTDIDVFSDASEDLDKVKSKEKLAEDRKRTKRLYERLSEVKKQTAELERVEMRKKNREKAQKFNQKLRMKIKKNSDTTK